MRRSTFCRLRWQRNGIYRQLTQLGLSFVESHGEERLSRCCPIRLLQLLSLLLVHRRILEVGG